jgi:hypothetical protein
MGSKPAGKRTGPNNGQTKALLQRCSAQQSASATTPIPRIFSGVFFAALQHVFWPFPRHAYGILWRLPLIRTIRKSDWNLWVSAVKLHHRSGDIPRKIRNDNLVPLALTIFVGDCPSFG